MRINQVEELVGISKKNIRFYEAEGLIQPQRNSDNGYREYTLEDVEILQQIKFFRKLSIPIEEIRKMQNKYLTLSDCMQRHLVVLSRQEKNLECMKEICKEILEHQEQLESIRVNDYLAKMDELEKSGVRFRDVKTVDTQKKRMRASLVSGGIMILLMLAVAVVVIVAAWPSRQAGTLSQTSIVILGFLLVMPLAMIIGIVLALRTRIKEIKGGELDEASNY